MSYFDWYTAASPLAARAHYEARRVAATPQAYAYADVLVKGYARARERGVRKSRTQTFSWPFAAVPTDIRAPLAALVEGFDKIVAHCTAPKPHERVNVGQVIHTTDLINAIGYQPEDHTGYSHLYRTMTAETLCLADFDGFLHPTDLDVPGSPPALRLPPLRVTALAALQQWLADVDHAEAANEKLASLIAFHYSGDVMAARIVAMTGWLLASTDDQRQRWSVAHHLLSADIRHRLNGTNPPQ